MERQAFELLEHGLKDIYDAEQKFVTALGTMTENATDQSLADGFRRHQVVTREQVRRLERAFDEIGSTPEREECAGAKGLIQEYEKFVSEQGPDGTLVDAFAAGAGLKVEHYEIASYRALIDLAEFCDFGGAAKLLKQNLAEEEHAAAELETATTKLGAKLAGAPMSAVAARVAGSAVDHMREGTLVAASTARAVGERAVDTAQRAIRTAERRGRKVAAKRSAASSTTRTTGRKARTRTAGAARTTARRTTRKAAGTPRRTARKPAGTTRRTTRKATGTARRTSSTRPSSRRKSTTARKTPSRKSSTARKTSRRRTSSR